MDPRTPKKRRALIMLSVVALVAVMLLPTAAIGAGTFDDVPDDHTFAADIEWLADAGITKGCNPADGNTKFCPDNPVTRGQMSAFMNRFNTYLKTDFLAIDGKADTAGHADTANEAEYAANADKLDGYDSTAFMMADDIVMTNGGNEWHTNYDAVPTFIESYISRTRIESGKVAISIAGPSMIGGSGYGIENFTVCSSGPGTIDSVSVYKSNTAGSSSNVLSDGTDRTQGCHTFTLGVDAGNGIGISVAIKDGYLFLEGVSSTWTTAAYGAGAVGTSEAGSNGN